MGEDPENSLVKPCFSTLEDVILAISSSNRDFRRGLY